MTRYCVYCEKVVVVNIEEWKDEGYKYVYKHCSQCGYCYESGFRYNTLIKQYIKYI